MFRCANAFSNLCVCMHRLCVRMYRLRVCICIDCVYVYVEMLSVLNYVLNARIVLCAHAFSKLCVHIHTCILCVCTGGKRKDIICFKLCLECAHIDAYHIFNPVLESVLYVKPPLSPPPPIHSQVLKKMM